MPDARSVAVIDIGKTNAKVALFDLATRSEVASHRQPNRPIADGPYPHHDIDALWTFILEGLATIASSHPIDAISVTTHGATAALVDVSGELVLPVIDYEFDGLDPSAYDPLRPPFDETGSPKLPMGLSVGAQLFWQQKTFPDAFVRTHAILTYPQFWTRRLTGVFASEVTSLGCHTDLWNPYARDFSSLVDEMGWRGLFPPLRRAGDLLGPLLPQVASRVGLPETTPVACGIHDSNASLLPHLLARNPPFAVVSTGTWVVAMAVGSRRVTLDPRRDTLVNANAFGDPVPSARFMGGREFETIMRGGTAAFADADWSSVLSREIMLLPSVQGGSGPYPASTAVWHGHEPSGGERFLAASFYLALMTATCLDLIGAEGDIVVEGPFAANEAYAAMLSAVTARTVTIPKGQSTGTSLGAALLVGGKAGPSSIGTAVPAGPQAVAMRSYARRWRALADLAQNP